MKTFEVLLTKSYKVKIKAETEDATMHYCEFYTGDISDISNKDDRAKYNFNFSGNCLRSKRFFSSNLNYYIEKCIL